jgi:hypothetical protein
MGKVLIPHRPQVLLQLVSKPFKSYDLKGFFFSHTIKLFIKEQNRDPINFQN